jgi:DNA-binding PadR family transcriptional regulator
MSVKRLPESPLALAVLALLYERPMHPYEMASTLKERRKERSIKLRYGSLYTVVSSLTKAGWIKAQERQREGARPERTVFALTPAGLDRLQDWLADLLARPVKEYPKFEAALSLMPVVPPAEAADLLTTRARHLDSQIAELTTEISDARDAGVPELFLVEADFAIAGMRTERRFVADLALRIRNGDIDGIGFWRDFHGKQSAGRRAPPEHS